MEKTEAVSKLKKAGYQVQFDSSVVTVLLTKRVNMNSEIKKIRTFLRESGYDASFGVRQIKDVFMEEDSWDGDRQEYPTEEENETVQTETAEIETVEAETIEVITDIEQFSLEDFGIS